MFKLFINGFLIGLAIAAPVGPIGILCINNSLQGGLKVGLLTGLGAATADGVYGFIAAFGLTLISTFLLNHQQWIQLGGGFFLCYLGIKTFLKETTKIAGTISKQNTVKVYLTTFILTLTNPMTILSYIAVFAGLGLGTLCSNYFAATLLVIGVILGSLLWWFLLSGCVALFRKKLKTTILRGVNYVSGLVILIFGLVALGSLTFKYNYF